MGRTPNGKKIAADKAGVAVTDRYFIFSIGNIVDRPMLAHKAHVAVEVIAGELQGNKELAAATFNARAIANGSDEGMTKLLFDDSPEAHGHGKILGGALEIQTVGTA